MTFKEKFTRLCIERNLYPTRVLQEVGMNKCSYSLWKPTTIPVPYTLNKIADYFGMTTDELLQGVSAAKETPLLEDLKNDPAKRLLFNATKGATSNEILKAAMLLENLKRSREEN